jgi:type IV pilus assembly protein PilA
MMKSIQKGFTLIELMIVVAIIGILAAIAIPAYQDYTIRSQVTEGMNLAGALKAAIAEQYAQTGAWPTDLAALGIDTSPSGKYVTGVVVDSGTINITYGNQANANISAAGSNILSLKPMLSSNDDVIWLCGYNDGTVGIAVAPVDPDSGPSGDNVTDLTGKYLPQSCRQQTAAP